MDNNKVAVVVVTYNQVDYIAQTIDSILSQHTMFDFVLYINDDCSTDGTSKVLKEYAMRYPSKINLQINNPNLGMPLNFYNVVNRADADYIAVCGGDDFWVDKEKLQKQISILDSKENVGLVYTDYYTCNENGTFTSEIRSGDVNYKSLMHNNSIAALTVCFKKNLYQKYIKDIKPDKRGWKMEDYPLLLWFSIHSVLFYLCDLTGAYRVLKDSITHQKKYLNKRIDFIDSVTNIKLFYNSIQCVMQDEAIRECALFEKGRLFIESLDSNGFRKIASQLHVHSVKSFLYKIVSYNKFVFNHVAKIIINRQNKN